MGEVPNVRKGSLGDEIEQARRLALELKKPAPASDAGPETPRLSAGAALQASDIARRLERVRKKIQDLEQERDNLQALSHTAALINSSLDLDEVLNEVMDTIIKLTGAERGYLMLRDEETGELEFRIARNMDQEALKSGDAFMVSKSIVRKVAESGEAILTTNALDDERFQDARSIVSFQLRSILCVPLRVREQITGAIYTDNKLQAGVFDESTRDLLQAFSHQAGVAVENARLFTRLKSTLDEISEMKKLQDDIFTSITSGVITTDNAGHITLVSPPAQRILGLDGERVVGRELHDVLPTFDARFDAMLAQARTADQEIASVEFETEVPQRGPMHLSVSFSPLKDAHNLTQGVAIVFDDQTEAKRREAQIAGVSRYLPTEVVDGIRSAEELRLGGTRQVITILFGDIRGFSTFSERLAPEALVEVINTYLTLASDAIHAQNGVIDKYMGDAVMALYNTPLRPQEDHALRAVRSAAQMMADIRAHHETVAREVRLKFGVGVHTGEAVVGNVGSPQRLDYTAMGDSVNLAKRLQEVAGPMQVLFSDSTYALVKDFVEVEELEPIRVKGRQQHTPVFELVRVTTPA